MHAGPFPYLFSNGRISRNLQHSNDRHLVVPMASSRPQKYPLKHRGAKLFNLLGINRIIAGEISLNSNQFSVSIERSLCSREH